MVGQHSWQDFLLEHYKQTSQNLRESDRNRNYFFWAYSALTIGALSLIFSEPTNLTEVKPAIVGGLVILILFGIGVAFYVTFARVWHCEYSSIAKAIYDCFQKGSYNLYAAAKSVREEEIRKKIHYFHVAGTEFVVFILVLLFVTAHASLVGYLCFTKTSCRLACILSCVVLIFGAGIFLYRWYLYKKEKKFPDKAWSVRPFETGVTD